MITCDTAIAHVAGALGVPVWVALCQRARLAVAAHRRHDPWYPTHAALSANRARATGPACFERIAKALLVQEFPDVQRKKPEDYRLLTSGFNRLTRTKQGLMLYNRHDDYIGRSIDRYGEFSAGEAELFEQVVRPGSTVVEAGANIGAHTLHAGAAVGPRGRVLRLRAAADCVSDVVRNVALNSIANVHCRGEALGEAPGTITIRPLDYADTRTLAACARRRPGRRIDRRRHARQPEPAHCHFLKVDVEGMEAPSCAAREDHREIPPHAVRRKRSR